jgi:hypothetical protein
MEHSDLTEAATDIKSWFHLLHTTFNYNIY